MSFRAYPGESPRLTAKFYARDPEDGDGPNGEILVVNLVQPSVMVWDVGLDQSYTTALTVTPDDEDPYLAVTTVTLTEEGVFDALWISSGVIHESQRIVVERDPN